MGLSCSNRKQLDIVINPKVISENHRSQKDKFSKYEGVVINDQKPITKQYTLINIENEVFKEEKLDLGDELIEPNPYMSSIYPPDNITKEKDFPPRYDLSLFHVFGYRCYDVKQNLKWLNDKTIIYPVSAICVIHNIETNIQNFLGGKEYSTEQHNDDILCIAISRFTETNKLIATGQLGYKPKIILWSLQDYSNISSFYLNKGSNEITLLSFSKNNKFLAALGREENNSFYIFDISKQCLVWNEQLGPNRILDMKWSPIDENEFTAVGDKVFFICHVKDKLISKGLFNTKSIESNLTNVFYITDESLITISETGYLYFWEETNMKKVIKISEYCLYVATFCEITNLIFIGDSANFLYCFNITSEKVVSKVRLETYIKSIEINNNGVLLLGMRDGTIQLICSNTFSILKIINNSHHDGEIKAIEFIPPKHIISVGQDNKILLWDIVEKNLSGKGIIDVNEEVSAKEMIEDYKSFQCAETIAFNRVYIHIAIGTSNGYLSIRNNLSNLNECLMNDTQLTYGGIVRLKYSPNGSFLAVSTSDKLMFILSVEKNYEKIYSFMAHTGNILNIDWDITSKFIQCVNLTNYLIYFSIDEGREISDCFDMRNTEWATLSCKFGWCIQGIFNGNSSNYITSICKFKDIIITGTNELYLLIYNYPCIKDNPQYKRYLAHSDNISSIIVNDDDNTLITIGGKDKSIMVWKIILQKD